MQGQNPLRLTGCTPPVGRPTQSGTHLQNKIRKEARRRIASLPSPGSFFNEKMLARAVNEGAGMV
jgi:hypothetical protein